MFLEKKLLITIGLFFSILFIATESKSQIIPDNSLPNNSNLERDGNIFKIKEGTIRGDNLFHSFSQFSIPLELEASFQNGINIKNIFTRITSNSGSNINGLISANGSANLFLINPNGIIFGENAQLNIGGSFLATTANAIEFNDGTKFDSIEEENPILTVSTPIGLNFGTNSNYMSDNSGLITVNGSGHSLNGNGGNPTVRGETSSNLSVLPFQNLALIGKEVKFSGGVLVSPSGNLDIASIRQGKVEITTPDNNGERWKLNYEDAEIFGNVTFTNRSLLDNSSIPNNFQSAGGSITVQGSNISSQDGSVILNQNFGNSDSGAINIIASDSFYISGTDPIARIAGGIRSETFSEGNGSDINISTPELSNLNGGSIQTFSYSPSSNVTSGDINVDTSDLQIIGASPRSAFTVSNITTFTFNTSQAGNIFINSDTINLESGGSVVSSGILGRVGAISVFTTEYLKITGFQPDVFISSGINSINSSAPIPGKINITSPNIFIQNGGSISTSTFAGGAAGELTINTDNLEITGQIDPQFETGLNIPSSIASSATFVSEALIQSLPETINIESFFTLPLDGNSGAIEINSNSININDGGQIAVFNQGTGNAGNLEIVSKKINISNTGSLNASTASGEGGNIIINNQNLELFNQSQITASAGGSGDGGNITINSETILGIQNSDITANAVGGDGGNITINSDAIVGLEERSQLTPLSDITATSEFGLDGTITIDSPESNADEDVVISAKEVDFDPYRELFKGSCLDPDRKGRRELVYVGAGRPESPYNFFDDEEPEALIDSYSTRFESNKPDTEANNSVPPLWQEGDPLIEPNAVQTNADGRKFLVSVEEREINEPDICTRNAEDLEQE